MFLMPYLLFSSISSLLQLCLPCADFDACQKLLCMSTMQWYFALQGPVILTLPSFDSNRYWIVPLQDAYTNTYANLGSDYNTQAGQYLIAGRSKLLSSTQ